MGNVHWNRNADLPGAVLLVITAAGFQHHNRWISLILYSGFIFLVCRWIWKSKRNDAIDTLGLGKCHLNWLVAGALLGILFAIVLRWDHWRPLVPSSVTLFLPVAACIGFSEEVAFRGFILGRLQSSLGWIPAILLSAIAHSAYKVALFINMPAIGPVYLGAFTLAAGILLGYLRQLSRSIWPCVAFHVLFDILVYGDVSTPWWIW